MINVRHLSDQAAYDMGYHSPATPSSDFEWGHLVQVNAYTHGQSDAQNQQPRNKNYDRDRYDNKTFERLDPQVTFE